MKQKIITISGASAVGKSFFVDKITEKFPNITEVIGLTTRPMREGEINGKSGIFISKEEMEQLEKEEKLMLVKEFFDNKYAWYKSDLVNTEKLKIINIHYRSLKELKENGLDLFSIFIRPASEEKIKKVLKSRTKSEQEYKKRLQGYYLSERYLKESKQNFDVVFTNGYDEKSLERLLSIIRNEFLDINKYKDEMDIDRKIENLLVEDKKIEHKIQLAKELILEDKLKNKEEEENDR